VVQRWCYRSKSAAKQWKHRSVYARRTYKLKQVIDKALERRKLYGTRSILFVKQLLETLNSV
jgi:hypothetical protein